MSSSAFVQTAPRSSRAVALITLGCAKNEVDSAHMTERMLAAGYRMVDDPAEADVVIVNTCSFIQAATEESLEVIFDLAGLPAMEEGAAKLVVAGCMPARYGEELEKELAEAHAFVPCRKEDDIVEILDGLLQVDPEPAASAENFDDVPVSSVSCDSFESLASSEVSAYVKISDGCDRFCSYCTIPYIRGRYHSFTYEDVCAEVDKHVARGAREIVLIAQDTGRWGADFEEKSSLATLMGGLAERHADVWFRVLYIQPEGITDELLDVIAAHENICSYLDIPLQHVSARILKAMNRTGSREEFEALLDHIQAKVPEVTLRTTLIAGFPGETEEEFEELCDFVEEAPFHYVGTFAYSQEEGTKAAVLPDQLDEEEKAERAQRLRDIADAVCTARVSQRIGWQMDVLVEGCEEDGQLFGRAMCQAPEVDGVVYLPDGEVGTIVNVRIADTLLYEMEGE